MRRSCLLAAITLLACGGNKGNATSDGGWDGGGGGGGGGGGVSVQPLSNDTFVFVREVREGAKHLYTYDTSTNQATLLSALDDDGQFGTSEVTGLAVSPDRKLIAFGALFRATVADKANPAHAIWTVTADGKTYARQTAPLPHPGVECTSDANCTYPERCNTLRGHCERYNTARSFRCLAGSHADGDLRLRQRTDAVPGGPHRQRRPGGAHHRRAELHARVVAQRPDKRSP